MTWRSSLAMARPRASACLSTNLGAISRPASSASSSLASVKLRRAAVMPVIRSAAGDREERSSPSARSRGAKPSRQRSQ